MMTLPRASRIALLLVAALAGLAASSCIYDSSQRCGPAMKFVEAANACVCDSDAIAVPGGCQRCAADEIAAAGVCACPAGQTKSAANLCVTVAGLGDPCNTTGAPCTDPVYSYCAIKTGTSGTCAKPCAGNTDCSATYTCATWEAHPYCRTFSGVGMACAMQSDCAATDAKYCDQQQSHSCVIQGCSLTKQDCPRGSKCCDFSVYGLGTLCGGGTCP